MEELSTPVTQPQATLTQPQSIATTPSHSSYLSRLFAGRMNRRSYWIAPFALWVAVVSIWFFTRVLLGLVGVDKSFFHSPLGLTIATIITYTWQAVGFFYSITFITRRLHDIGASGWYCLLLLVPFANILFVVILGLLRGNATNNKYGTPPTGGLLNAVAAGLREVGRVLRGASRGDSIALWGTPSPTVPASPTYRFRFQQTTATAKTITIDP